MQDPSHKSRQTLIFWSVLSAELLFTILVLPMPSNEAIHNFLLVSMGLLFIPLVLAGAAVFLVVWLQAFVAKVIAQALVPDKKRRH